jgi:hypothetical protein
MERQYSSRARSSWSRVACPWRRNRPGEAASARGGPFALLARYGNSPSQPAAHWVVMADLEGNEFCVGTKPFSDT